MPRKKGSLNADFDAARAGLVARLRAALLGSEPPSSYRALAKAAGVTIPTLRHYFADREGVYAAVFADCHAGGQSELDTAATPSGPFPESIRDLVRHFADGFRYGGLTELHAVGLAEGFGNRRVAAAFLGEVFEPTLAATQVRLEAHVARGEMRPTDARHAALRLVGPILLAFLHQHALGGSAGYPLDLDAFAADHAAAFVAAHATDATGR